MFFIPRFDRKRFSMPANFAYRGGLLLFVSAAYILQNADAQSPARLRPDGIIGTIFLSNADSAPDEVAENFVEASGGEDANLVILVGGRKRPTTDEEKAILARWEKLEPADVQVIGIGDLDQPGDMASAAKLREASGVWLTGIDAATLAATARGTKLRDQLQALLDHRGVVGIEGSACGLLAKETFVDGKSATASAGINLLADCVVDPAFDHDAEQSRLNDIIEKKPNTLGIGLPTNTTLVIVGRDIRPLDGSAYVVLPPGKNWQKRAVELRDRRPGDWNQLHRSVRDRAKPDYLPTEAALPEVAHGSLVIIGGGGTPADVLKRFIELAGGRDAQFVVFPTAMPDPINASAETNFLKRAGVKHVTVLPARDEKEVDSAENLAVLKKATGVWFGGGRQWRFVDAYEGTKTAELIRDVLRRGGVIGGSSAGATIQGDYLVRGSPFGPEAMMCEGYERGLCFLPGVAIDQHFTARNRFADMTSLMKKYPQFLGIGIDESTALVVQDHTAEIIGKGKVHFYDRRKAIDPDGPDYEVAAAGDKYDFKESQVIPGEKEPEKKDAERLN
jgi:cyanophycinase